MSSIDRIHFGTEAHLPWAELLVHIVQGVSHRINSIDHKLHLSFLLIVGVLSYPLLICKTQRGVHQTHYNHNYSLSVSVDYMHFDHGKCTRRSHMFGSLLTMCEVKMCFWVVKQSGTLNPEDNQSRAKCIQTQMVSVRVQPLFPVGWLWSLYFSTWCG